MADLIKGYVEHIIFHNAENGYTVLSLAVEHEEVTLVGQFSSVNEGEYLEAEGSFQFHPTYGQQFKAEQVRVTVPTEGAALERYLASGAVRGVGAALAARIVKRFGDETMRILEEEPERVEALRRNVRFLLAELARHGVAAKTDSAVVPIVLGTSERALRAAAFLRERGFLVSAIRYPSVAENAARLRIAVMATHREDDLAELAEAVAEAVR